MRLIDADKMRENLLWCKEQSGSYNDVYWDDVIERLDVQPTVGGWISVKDRLPEEKENPMTQDFAEVICLCDFGGIPKRTDVRTYKFGKRIWAEGGHFWNSGQIMDGIVTHWMPLPEPPAEGEEQ